MALISKKDIFKIEKARNNVHKQVKASYTVFTSGDQRYFQIDTYGTPDRKMKDTSSQSIQLDKETAEELIFLLKQAFNID